MTNISLTIHTHTNILTHIPLTKHTHLHNPHAQYAHTQKDRPATARVLAVPIATRDSVAVGGGGDDDEYHSNTLQCAYVLRVYVYV